MRPTGREYLQKKSTASPKPLTAWSMHTRNRPPQAPQRYISLPNLSETFTFRLRISCLLSVPSWGSTTFCVALSSNSKSDYIHKRRQREGKGKPRLMSNVKCVVCKWWFCSVFISLFVKTKAMSVIVSRPRFYCKVTMESLLFATDQTN